MILFINTKLKYKATSNIEVQQVFLSLSLNNVWIYLRDAPYKTDVGIVNLHSSEGTQWVCYTNENCFDSYGCVCPKKLSELIIKRYGYCLYSEYQIQQNDSFYASYCLYIIYLTKVLGMDFLSPNKNLYYQMI